jgi:di/tricarboxylate transporter
MLLAFALLAGAMVLFALEIYPVDFVALAILAIVLVLGPVLGVTPLDAISASVGRTVAESGLGRRAGIRVLEIVRQGVRFEASQPHPKLEAEDLLVVTGRAEALLGLRETEGLALEADKHIDARDARERVRLVEIVIGPNSDLIGSTLRASRFFQRYGSAVLAIRKHGRLLRERLGSVRLEFGDTFLLRVPERSLPAIRREPGFVLAGELEHEPYRSNKTGTAFAIFSAVVLVAALGVPILVTSIAGAVRMVLTGCLRMDEVHSAIRWDVILLLAGVIPLGLALVRTGGAQFIADLVTRSSSGAPPVVVLAAFYVATMLITEFISNNGAAVVMVPIAITAARTLKLDSRAFVLAVMFAASTSFSTPVGYQTNTLVYGPGGYRFLDFLRVGGPLNLLLAVVTPLLIALLWGL